MANEISKLITPDGVSHDIADAVARQASYDVSNKVNKTGDTMTGNLTVPSLIVNGTVKADTVNVVGGTSDALVLKPVDSSSNVNPKIRFQYGNGAFKCAISATDNPTTVAEARLHISVQKSDGTYIVNDDRIPFLSDVVTKNGDPLIVNDSDLPQGAANLSGSATTHRVTMYRNGLSIPYQADNTNDGGILRVRGTSESDCILELGTWDDSGSGETIQFNYYPTNSQVTPTYSVTVPKKSGTIALAGDVVAKNGDTMTGDLNFTDRVVRIKDTTVKPGTTPSSNVYGEGYYLNANDDQQIGYLRTFQGTDTRVGLQIEVHRNINGTDYYNSIVLGVNDSGSKSVVLSDAGAWRSAIGHPFEWDINTNNTTDTWVPVMTGSKLQHRVLHASLNAPQDLTYTRVNGNVSNDAKCRRYGNIVEFTGQFCLSSSSLARDTILWNGFPKPKTVVYFTARCEGNWTTYSFYMSTNGEIKNQQANIPSGTYNCNLVYICQ